MALITWREFSTKSEIKSLPLHEQKKQFLWENQRRAEENWFLEAQLMNGGGGGGGFAGNASDGPLNGSTVTTDVGTTTTDALGNFTFTQTPTSEITVTGGTDSITGVAFTGELKGFPQYKTVSPLTTLAYHLKEEDATLTADTAVDLLFASSSTLFGIELQVADKDIMLNKDYVAESILADNQKAIAAQSIATYLESVTEMVGSALRGAASAKFTDNNAKVEGYKSISRQINNMRGAKTEINPQTLFDVVKLPNGADWTVTGSLDTTARQTIKTNLGNVRTQLATLSRSEAYTANYLTTQIQAINRGVKEDYSLDAKRLAEGTTVEFDTIDTMIGKSTGSLAQIESGKTNETTRSEGEKPETFYTFGAMTFTQIDSRGDTQTLSGDAFVSGSMKAIAATDSAFTERDALRRYIIKSNRDALSLDGARNYNTRLGDVTALQTVSTQDARGADAGKIYEIVLSNPSLQIKSISLDLPATNHIHPTGTYTLGFDQGPATQVLTIRTGGGRSNNLIFGEIPDMNIGRLGITVNVDEEDPTKFIVTTDGVARTPRGGSSFSNNVLSFTPGRGNYTITYTT
mgnify:CR=1 FL=1